MYNNNKEGRKRTELFVFILVAMSQVEKNLVGKNLHIQSKRIFFIEKDKQYR